MTNDADRNGRAIRTVIDGISNEVVQNRTQQELIGIHDNAALKFALTGDPAPGRAILMRRPDLSNEFIQVDRTKVWNFDANLA